ncbi:MAG: hypothetical protein JWR83_3275 [Aeromicrobium sp.]|nr:hypothetical protein [Aeromicrobium sp.]
MIAALFALCGAAAFAGLGRWGVRNVDSLVPAGISLQGREKDQRSIRRGARSCYVISALFAVFLLALIVGSVTG